MIKNLDNSYILFISFVWFTPCWFLGVTVSTACDSYIITVWWFLNRKVSYVNNSFRSIFQSSVKMFKQELGMEFKVDAELPIRRLWAQVLESKPMIELVICKQLCLWFLISFILWEIYIA